MSGERKGTGQGISKQAEEGYLKRTLAVVKDNVANYGREVARMQEDIDEMLAHYHDNDAEVYTILSNTVTMHDHMKWALERNEKALNKPYFGRIIFHDMALDKEESLYIGKGGISLDATHQMVVDWRAPVANAYYENSLGKCSYAAPGGKQMDIDLKLKRTYEIENGQLGDYFDSEVVANDDLLTKYLAKNKQAVLNEIVATIQKEQNEIIRKSPYHNIIVQGVAGSGKTTVAMHRISFILYNYAERFRPDDFYIVGSNRILLDYITSVLPDLDVHGIRQMTMEQLFVRLLYEDWDEKKYFIKGIRQNAKSSIKGGDVKADSPKNSPKSSTPNSTIGSIVKGGSQWFRDLEEYCRKIERESISTESIYLNPRQFVEGFKGGKTGVFDETAGETVNPKSLVCLVEGAVVEEYLRENPSVSVQNKIDMLNQRLTGKIKDEFLGKGVKYTEAERKAILKAYRGRYGGREWKRSIYEMYQDFLMKQVIKGYEVEIPDREFDVYDLAALAYLYKRIKEKEVISEAHHIVIDEAQDFGMMAYHVLKFCVHGCTYTVMGDVSQNIHFGYGLNDWEELKALLLKDEMDSFGLLKKSYRNTVEISNFATNILHHGSFSVYPAEPIIRHGNPVQVKQVFGYRELIREAAGICKGWQQNGLDTIAVICRDLESASEAAKELAGYVDVMESNLEKAVFGSGIMVLPVEYTKGLEFDAVLVLNPTRKEYPVEDGHAKLLYVAATRALHELCVIHTGNLTGLIAAPVPERRIPEGQEQERQDQEVQDQEVPNKQELKRQEPKYRILERQKTEDKQRWTPERQESEPQWKGQEALDKQQLEGTGKNESPLNGKEAAISGKQTAHPASEAGKRKKPVAIAKPRAAVSIATPESKKPFIIRQKEVFSAGNASPIITSAVKPYHSDTSAKSDTPEKPVRRKLVDTDREGTYRFGDLPATEALRPAGHGKIDLAVRWVEKRPDGLYLQSRYGILRLSPVSDTVIRITFAKGGPIAEGSHPHITAPEREPVWMYKSSGSAVEVLTDELCIQVEKSTGMIRYMTRDKKLLLSEKSSVSRQLEAGSGGKMKTWLYLAFAKGETLYAINQALGNGADSNGNSNSNRSSDSSNINNINNNNKNSNKAGSEENLLKLRGTARYISYGNESPNPPFLFSDKNYGLAIAADGPVLCCDIPAYGSYLYAENEVQMDYFFITGKNQKEMIDHYKKLVH